MKGISLSTQMAILQRNKEECVKMLEECLNEIDYFKLVASNFSKARELIRVLESLSNQALSLRRKVNPASIKDKLLEYSNDCLFAISEFEEKLFLPSEKAAV